jgi:hypothetical protein
MTGRLGRHPKGKNADAHPPHLTIKVHKKIKMFLILFSPISV